MKPLQSILLLTSLCFAALALHAANPIRKSITTQLTVIALPKTPALQFTSGHHLEAEAATGFKDLQSLVEQKKAEVAASPAITSQDGQRATSEAGTTKLEIEPVLSPSSDQVDINLLLNYGNSVKLSTACLIKNGDVKFLGAFDAAEANKDLTYLVFVRVSAPK